MDAGTIEQARQGNRTAQAALLGELQDVWYRMSLSLLHDPESARDATQETALRFLKQLSGFRGDSQIRTWSLGIAINVCRESKRRGRHIPEPLRLDGMRREDPGPAASAEVSETRVKVRELLADLPERQREAILLRFFEELSVEETAAAMNCAAGTVKATVHQAMQALRKKLGTFAS